MQFGLVCHLYLTISILSNVSGLIILITSNSPRLSEDLDLKGFTIIQWFGPSISKTALTVGETKFLLLEYITIFDSNKITGER